MKRKIIKNIPNGITISRIIASIIAPIIFIFGNLPFAIGLYIYGAVSDFFDGMCARKLNAFTNFGKKLDPISDKIFAASLILPSLFLGNLFMILPLILEGIIAFTNYKIIKKHHDFDTERIGKIKTNALFPEAIIALIATKVPAMYFLFTPLYVITIYLQLQTINAYKNQMFDRDNEKMATNIVNNNENVESTKKEKKLSLKEELLEYTFNPIKNKNIKVRKLKYNNNSKNSRM